MRRHALSVLATSAILAAMPAPASAQTASQQPVATASDQLSVGAIRLCVTDLADSVAFYTKHFAFTQLGDFRERGYGVLENHGTLLVLTKAEHPIAIADEQCHVRINFAVADLEAKRGEMQRDNVEFTGEGTSGVGRWASFLDPSGNRHNIKQLNPNAAPEGVSEGPLVYDVGISITDMKQAEAFYVDTLGFEVMTRKYYPPVIPITQRGCAFFILSEGAKTPAPYEYDRAALTGLAFNTDDLAATMKRLRDKGVKFIVDEPRRSGTVRYAAFVDQFGNVHEVVEHDKAPPAGADKAVSPGALRDQPPKDAAPAPAAAPTSALAQLDWLAGRWLREEPGQHLEEIWSPPAGDTLTGMFRWTRNGKAWMCELMSITVEGDKTLFRLRHFDRTLKPWEKETPLTYGMIKLTDNEVVFEDPKNEVDHPRRFIYQRAGDELSVILEGADGDRDVFTFKLAEASGSADKPAAPSPIDFTGGMLVRFQTADRKKAVQWYQDVLGFEILLEVDEIGWSELANREAKLTIGLQQNPADAGGANASTGTVPVIGVQDLDAARRHLESKGVKFTGATETIEGLVKLATLLDPDGHRIMLYQSLGGE